jgi:hypothetical protein
MRFCIHLVHQKIVSPEQFVAAMEQYLKARKPIGRLAIEAGLISMKQVFEILERQTGTQRKFGRIAIDLGYLTEEQLAALLFEQSTQNQSIGEILVAKGAISREQMEAEFKRFRRERSKQPDLQESCICGSGCGYHLHRERSGKPEIPVLSF